jgi:hypothetical protein
MNKQLYVPAYDSNSDHVVLVSDPIQASATPVAVKQHQLLVEFETSKSVYEFLAPGDGYFMLTANIGSELAIGECFGVLAQTSAEALHAKMHPTELESVSLESQKGLSKGVLLELKKRGIGQDQLERYLSENRIDPTNVSRQNIESFLDAMDSSSELSTSQKLVIRNVRDSWTKSVPLWVTTFVDCETFFPRYKDYARSLGLRGGLMELALWAVLKLAQTEDSLFGYIWDGRLHSWGDRAVKVVFNNEGVLQVPSFSVGDEDPSLVAVSKRIVETQRRIVTNTMTALDHKGGGPVLSVISDSWLHGFNALPLPKHSVAFAVAGPSKLLSGQVLPITLTYDHQYIDGSHASKILGQYVNIMSKVADSLPCHD